jgi:hypothetical protein
VELWKSGETKMSTKVLVDNPICGFKTLITVVKEGPLTKVKLTSGCAKINDYGNILAEVKNEDLYRAQGSKIFLKAQDARLTPTCVVPVALMNACWIENQLMSKNLALEKKEIKIIFEE